MKLRVKNISKIKGSLVPVNDDRSGRDTAGLHRGLQLVQDVANQVVIAARAGLRHVLSRRIFPARSESAQMVAGMASAQAVLGATASLNPSDIDHPDIHSFAKAYGLTHDQLLTGLDNFHGASDAAGGSNHLNSPDPSIPQDQGVAAFFDVDNTLIKGASILLFARGLAKRRFFTGGEIAGFIWKQVKFRISGTEDVNDIASGREQALALVKGHKEAEVVQMAEEIWAATIAERIFPGTKELADMHLQAGQQVWLVTATPVQLAQIIARELGFTGALGTVAEVKDGEFTGRMVGDILHGSGKKHAVVALAAHEKLDLSRCTAYSDSVNDLPLLSMVGTAVAVNPDSQLRKAARDNRWEIRDYRRGRKVIRSLAGAGVAAMGAGGYWISRR